MAERHARRLPLATPTGIHHGTVSAIEDDGAVTVRSLTANRAFRCEVLESVPELRVGDRVLFVVPDDAPEHAYVLGVVARASVKRRVAGGVPLRDATPRRPAKAPTWPRQYVTTATIRRRDEKGVWLSVPGRSAPMRGRLGLQWDDKALEQIEAKRERLLVEVDLSAAQPSALILGFPVISPNLSSGIEASRIVLEGKEEIVLRTRRSMIVLRSNGDIEILGNRISSRGRESQKIAAPMLKLN